LFISLTTPCDSHCTPFSFAFFYRYVHHLDLPSFPTRRSSDLAELGTAFIPICIFIVGVVFVLPRGHFVGRQRDIVRFIVTDGVGDRKSTRLNSSHVSISYAVFCLKKKNTTQHQHSHNPTLNHT